MESTKYDYDLFVIGGGSGGMSAARVAALGGAKVGLADYVTPSPQGTQWGVGGTCVNVGCIPKKLMHFAALLGESREDQNRAGWTVDEKGKHDWEKMTTAIKKHIFSLYWAGKKMMKLEEIDFHCKLAKFVDAHTLELYTPDSDKTQKVTAKYIVISTGGRPTYPETEGVKEHCISSDDVFYLSKAPGKTLIVGAGYIALETAGFLNGLGLEVHVSVRSSLLRTFDQDVASRIGKFMESKGIKFLHGTNIAKIEKLENGKKRVTLKGDKEDIVEEYDTVMMAVGRTANTAKMNLEAAGVEINKQNLKVKVNDADQTTAEHIFSVGDCADGRPELTPTAVMAGTLLSQRLFLGSKELMDYVFVPTTVFTPLEYGSTGYSEKDAQEKFGKDNVLGYHGVFKPLEWAYSRERPGDACYIKMVCKKDENQTVIGLHFLGPNAGEVIQGFGVAVKFGLGRKHFEKVVGIHPTVAEEVLGLHFKTSEKVKVSEGCVGCGF